MTHECKQEKRLRDMELDVAVAKSDIKNVKDDVRDIKNDTKEICQSQKTLAEKIDRKFNHLTWQIIGLLVAICGTLVMIIYNNLIGG